MWLIVEFYRMMSLYDKIGLLFAMLLAVMYANYIISKYLDKKYPQFIPPKKKSDGYIATLPYKNRDYN